MRTINENFMKADDFNFLWNIEAYEGCEVECPECKEWSKIEDWRETELYCELCGDHAAAVCPECDVAFDHVWGPRFETRDAQDDK